MNQTLWSQFADAVDRGPDATALVAQDALGAPVRLTYAALCDRAVRAAAGFARLGVRPGDPVLLQLPNRAEFAVVVLALFRLGARPVFALPAHRSAELRHVARASGAEFFVTTDTTGHGRTLCDHRDLARDLLTADGVRVRTVLVAGDPEEFCDLAQVSVERTQAAEAALPAPPEPSDQAFLQLSGGTTGLPKLIPRTHATYAYTVSESARICGLSSGSVMLVVLPVAHNYPLSSPGVLGTWHVGGTVVLTADPAPRNAFPLIAAEGVTHTSLVPPLALLWTAAAEDGSEHDLSSLQVVGIGGAKCTPELARRVPRALGAQLQQVFGMAEGLVNYTRLDDPEEVVLNTQGRPISPDDEIRVVDEEDRDVPAGERGLLLTRGPYTIRGYVAVDGGADAHNLRAFTADGFYRTGDVVRARPDGNLVVEGRDGDRINRGGEKVSAEEVEDVLLTHPGVHDVAVVGIPDEFLGERTCAFVVPGTGNPPTVVDVRRHVRAAGLAEFKVPDRVELLDHFPPTAVGKTSRRQLRAVLADLVQERTP